MNKHKLRHLDLFSGIGGFSLGLEATGGFETVAFCDIEEYPRKVLAKHWPRVKQYTDIKELSYDKLKSDGIISDNKKIDIITGGYPCQPFSVAGRKKGEEDPRHLWPEYLRLIQELRPTWVIGENVSGHIKLGLDTVLQNLADQMYSTRTFSISASSVGANHQRERIWIVANANGGGDQQEKSGGVGEEKRKTTGGRTNHGSPGISDGTDTIIPRKGSAAEVGHLSNPGELGRNDGGDHREGRQVQADEERKLAQDQQEQEGRKSGSGTAGGIGNSGEPREDKGDEPGGGEIPQTVADAIEGNAQTGRERRRTVREVGRGEGVSSDAAGGGEIGGSRDMANASREGSQGSGVESDVEGETIQESAARSGQEGIFSNTERIGQQGQGKPVRPGDPEEDCEGETDRLVDESEGAQGWWDLEPNVGRVDHGVPKRVDRLKCLGNSLIPHIPYYIGCSILESYYVADADGEKSLDAQETRDDGEDGEKSPDQYSGGRSSAPRNMADADGGNGRGRRTIRPGGEDGEGILHPKEEEQA